MKTKSDIKKIYYSDLYGLREKKYDFLYKNSIETVNWEEITNLEKNNFFVKKKFKSSKKYESFYSLPMIFKVYNSGIKTKRDEFIISFTRKELDNKLKEFISPKLTKEDIIKQFKVNDTIFKDKLGKDRYEFEINDARAKLVKEGLKESLFKEYHYRPFDIRWTYYSNILLSRPRSIVMNHLIKSNLGLISTRLCKTEFKYVFITNSLCDEHLISDQNFVFPLYIYSDDKRESSQLTLTGSTIKSKSGKQPNFTDDFLKFIAKKYPKKDITPEEILGYIYAVLHSLGYRKKYQEFLKVDFPQIPFVNGYKAFKKLSKLGSELIELHLMEKDFKKNVAKFEISGSNEVEKVKYEKGKVFINKEQYFEKIPEEVWEFYIGGYQVLDKWLKSRKERKLTHSEIETFIKIVNILSETIKLMDEINKIKID